MFKLYSIGYVMCVGSRVRVGPRGELSTEPKISLGICFRNFSQNRYQNSQQTTPLAAAYCISEKRARPCVQASAERSAVGRGGADRADRVLEISLEVDRAAPCASGVPGLI